MNEPPPDHRNQAGPYGFTRREILILAGIVALSIVVILYSEWRDRKNQTPGWVIEDVLIDPPVATATSDSTTRALTDTVAARPMRDYSDVIDINTADARALSRLPGIGTELARRIIEEREANGAFLNLTDLQRVRGIGGRKAAMLSGWVKFSNSSSSVDSAETP